MDNFSSLSSMPLCPLTQEAGVLVLRSNSKGYLTCEPDPSVKAKADKHSIDDATMFRVCGVEAEKENEARLCALFLPSLLSHSPPGVVVCGEGGEEGQDGLGGGSHLGPASHRERLCQEVGLSLSLSLLHACLTSSHRFQAGKVKLSTKDVKELKSAKQEGSLHEALLDRREKTKADRYCK